MGELKPCPFCASRNIDPAGWMSQNPHTHETKCGPCCDDCGASAESVAIWNTRPRTEGRGEQEPVAWRIRADGLWSIYHSREDAEAHGRLFLRPFEIQPLYASPIREPEISRAKHDEIEKLLRENLPATCGLHCQREQTQAEEDAAYRYTADAILNLAPVGADPMDLPPAEQFALATKLAANVGYELTPEPEHPDSPHARHPVGGRGEGWRPIETAPKDGTAFMVWAGGYEWPEVVRWEAYSAEDAEEIGEPGYWTYAESLMADATDDCGSKHWTAWQPLPPPPQEQGGMK